MEAEECNPDTLGHSHPAAPQRCSTAAVQQRRVALLSSEHVFGAASFTFMFNYLPRYWALASCVCVFVRVMSLICR